VPNCARAQRDEVNAGDNPTIQERMEWFSRAITNLRSCRMGEGDFARLQQVSEKQEVAREQLRVFDALTRQTGGAGAQSGQAVAADLEVLERRLQEISPLYNEYAYKHELWECCLHILVCAAASDQGDTASDLWDNIISSQHREEDANPFADLITTLDSLGRQFYRDAAFAYPLQHLVEVCEILECHRLRTLARAGGARGLVNEDWLLSTLLGAGVHHNVLFRAYCAVPPERIFAEPRSQVHLLYVEALLLRRWLLSAREEQGVVNRDRAALLDQLPAIRNRAQDQMAKLQTLQTEADHITCRDLYRSVVEELDQLRR
jgi:hypothetical protein